MNTRTAGQVFPPGEFIQEELEARAWTQEELGEIMGRPRRLVNELVAGKRSITPETATALGAAFGTSAELWMNLESAYRLSLVEFEAGQVARRAKAYELAPIKDMVKRGWIKATEDVDGLECELGRFFDIASLDDEPQLALAGRRSSTYGPTTPAQFTWACRARALGEAVSASRFASATFERELPRLRELIRHEADVRRVPKLLADLGVRLVIVEPLPRSKMDGLTLWLSDTAPVVAVSVRLDRIDHFWFTVFHECMHVKHGEASIDENLVGEGFKPTAQKPKAEQRADREAAELLLPRRELDNFILRTRPLYDRTDIVKFANQVDVHPGIIVGQLQRRGEVNYSQLRDTLVNVRDLVTEAALTDGWGFTPPANAQLRRHAQQAVNPMGKARRRNQGGKS